jgi:hypothetical protein
VLARYEILTFDFQGNILNTLELIPSCKPLQR